jgi:hypothetical protein
LLPVSLLETDNWQLATWISGLGGRGTRSGGQSCIESLHG